VRVRYANIPRDLRDRFEQFGEDALTHALAVGVHSAPREELADLLNNHRPEIWDWLTEKRDLTERRRRRLYVIAWLTLLAAVAAVLVGIIGIRVTLVH
jgi:type VI protein secretion system component VasF